MKLSKEMYQEALGKITNAQSQEETAQSINQKYKDDILHGRLTDDLAGWSGENVYYDKEMLKKEGNRKILFIMPFIIIGLILLVAVGIYTYEHFYTRIFGTKIQVEYVKSSKILEHNDEEGLNAYDGYIFCWKEDENSQENSRNRSTSYPITCFNLLNSRKVNLYVGYDERSANVDGARNMGSGYYERMKTQGFEPNEAYILVYPEELSGIYEYEKGQYVNLYYNEKDGETFLNLRIMVRWWIVLLADGVVIIWNFLWIRRLVRLVMEQRRLD